MQKHENEAAVDVVELGDVTVQTLGVWDPLLKENHDTPESFPM